jgi:putative DNA primase/helicase
METFMVVNHLPHVNGTDRGIWRRIKVIPFLASFEGKNRDKEMSTKLKAEMSGILNWAIEGCLKWQQQGLQEPAIMIEAAMKYMEEEDAIGEFLREHTTDAGPDCCVRAADLYERYAKNQKDNGQRSISQKLFAQKLAIKGLVKRRGDKGRSYYYGIRLRPYGD